MKLTNNEIFSAKEPLEKLMSEKLPIKASYGLAKLAHKLNDQLQIIDEVRVGLFKTYGEPNPSNNKQLRCLPMIVETDDKGNVVKAADGNPIMIDNPVYPKFMSEMNELMAQEVEIVFEVVTLPSTLEIEPAIVMALDKFITIA